MECIIVNPDVQIALDSKSTSDKEHSKVEVVVKRVNLNSEQSGVFSKSHISKGTTILQLELENLTDKPNKYTLQVDDNKHVSCESYEWIMYLNHRCDANLKVEIFENILKLSLTKDVNTDEEITFNYLTTEFDIAESFVCKCDSRKCYNEIKGFKYLSNENKIELFPMMLPYLKEKIVVTNNN